MAPVTFVEAMEGLRNAENWLKKNSTEMTTVGIAARWGIKKLGKKSEGFQFWATKTMQVEERGWRVRAQNQSVLR